VRDRCGTPASFYVSLFPTSVTGPLPCTHAALVLLFGSAHLPSSAATRAIDEFRVPVFVILLSAQKPAHFRVSVEIY
jgi:hypothetical protein